jgi:LPS sulfotransferase NodH
VDSPSHYRPVAITDPSPAEHDLVPPFGPDRVIHPYLVCATQRTGSALLCRGLAATGVAGNPFEYFNLEHRRPLEARWGCDGSLAGYAATLMRDRSTPNGQFGSKLHWEHLQQMRAELAGEPGGDPGFTAVDASLLERLLPGVHYVRILRLDIDRQAVSLWTALRRRQFAARWDEDPALLADVAYDFRGIARCRRLLAAGELHWDRFFRTNGIRPIEIVYEDFVLEYAGTLRRVIETLVPGAAHLSIPPPATRRLHDARTEAMVARFRDELKSQRQEALLSLPERIRRRLFR